MSGTTFTWTGTTSSDWNTATNWSPAGIPNSPTATAVVNSGGGFNETILSGGSSAAVSSLNISDNAHVVVGGSKAIGGGGGGTLISSGTINATSTNTGGALVGGLNTTVSAPTVVLGPGATLGGGGVFEIGNFLNSGRIQADGEFSPAPGESFGLGPLTITGGTITGPGSLEVGGPSTLDLGSATDEKIAVITDPGETATIILENPDTFTGSLDLANANTHLDIFLKGETPTGAAYDPAAKSLVISDATGPIKSIPITSNGTVFFDAAPSSTMTGFGEVAIVCYARGTRIATPGGPVPVEKLKKGELVLTADGEEQPVIWLGRRRVDCQAHPDPEKVWPIRIKAGAFGPNMPERDLLVSPQHAIFDEGVLVPAKYLVNGRNVVVERTASVEYYHVELPRHDLLLAEGLPSESYLENNDRDCFENGGGVVRLHPDFSTLRWDARACAVLKVTGPEVDRIKEKLAGRAKRRRPRRQAA
jgi:hypothetical protein